MMARWGVWVLYDWPSCLSGNGPYLRKIAVMPSFYGTWLIGDDNERPHLNWAKVTRQLYTFCTENDELCPTVIVKKLDGLFDQTKNKGELEIQMGVHHGFAFPQRWCYDKPAAERHW